MSDRVPCFRRPLSVEGLVLPCALVLLVLIPPARSLAQESEIPWRPSYEHALAEARAQNRPVWLQFTGPWCQYCAMMESTTFRTAEVIAEAQSRVVPVKVRADVREDLLATYGVSGLPATILLDPQGRVVSRYQGYIDPSSFLGVLLSVAPETPEPSGPGATPALAGFCPVQFVKSGRLVSGSEKHSLQYDGQAYRFSSDKARALFLAEPERYLPRNQGQCVVSQVDEGGHVAGNPRFGVYYQDRLYLCADDKARRAFASDPARYADADLGLHGNCPHCQEIAGRSVPGSRKYPLTLNGTRYLFPDDTHRAAFRADPERFLR